MTIPDFSRKGVGPRFPPVVLVACAIAFPLVFTSPAITTIGIWTLLYVAGAAAWNLFSGFSGYISFAHAGFYGVGAYATLLLARSWNVHGGYGMFLLLPIAGIVAGAAAVLVGAFALRTRNMVFAMVTIAVFFSGQILAFNLTGLTNGSIGLESPIAPWGPGFYDIPFYYVALLLAIVATVASFVIRRSRFGLFLRAIRDDEDRAAGYNIPTASTKLIALAGSAVIFGMIGGVYGLYAGSIYPQFAFDPIFDSGVLTCVLIGGLGTVYGPVAGAVLLIPLQQWLLLQTSLGNWYLLIEGAILLLVIVYAPAGLVPRLQEWHARLRTPPAGQLAGNGDPGGASESIGRHSPVNAP